MYKKFEIVHFVGIGGAGMSGIAEVLKNLDYNVRGSDVKETETIKRLRALGIDVVIGHKSENVAGAHLVVVSSAISGDNPEVIAARRQAIPVIPRAEMLAEIARLKQSVLIAGAHGKTTTTSLIASVLAGGGLDPTVVIGGKLKGIGSHAKLGQGEFLVAEADESDGSFLKLTPTIAVVTNIDKEHMDFFKSIDELKSAFLTFINKIPFYGLSILCSDNEYLKGLLPDVQRRHVTYGLKEGADLAARDVRMEGLGMRFEAVLKGISLGVFNVPLPGSHSVCNSLAAIAVANELEIDMDKVKDALKNFSGVQRRFEFKGDVSGIKVFDDYGHHPTEVKAILRAAKDAVKQNTPASQCEAGRAERRIQNTDAPTHPSPFKGEGKGGGEGRLIVLFQPHRYTRTRDLLSDFYDAFRDADKVILMDIYPAGEKPLNGINSQVLFEGIKAAGTDVEYIRDRGGISGYLAEVLREGDIFLTLGAGDVWKMGEEFLKIKNEKSKI